MQIIVSHLQIFVKLKKIFVIINTIICNTNTNNCKTIPNICIDLQIFGIIQPLILLLRFTIQLFGNKFT